jgi:hypothetical protein
LAQRVQVALAAAVVLCGTADAQAQENGALTQS